MRRQVRKWQEHHGPLMPAPVHTEILLHIDGDDEEQAADAWGALVCADQRQRLVLQPLQIEELIQDIPLKTLESKFLLTSLRSRNSPGVEGSRPTTCRVWQLLEEEDRNQVLQHLGTRSVLNS